MYSKKNDGEYYDVGKHLKDKIPKDKTDKIAVDMEKNGFVSVFKRAKGYLPSSIVTEYYNTKLRFL